MTTFVCPQAELFPMAPSIAAPPPPPRRLCRGTLVVSAAAAGAAASAAVAVQRCFTSLGATSSLRGAVWDGAGVVVVGMGAPRPCRGACNAGLCRPSRIVVQHLRARGGEEAAADVESTPAYQEFARRHLVDEPSLLSESSFQLPPEELIKLAKRFLATEAPEATIDGGGAMMTEDFRFVGPVIGPLDKDEFIATKDTVDFFRSFPDATAGFHHFRVDPFDPARVWFTARASGTHTGEAVPGSDAALLFGEVSGKRFTSPPQACSLLFTPEGKVKQFTIGYVMDRCIGNTGGMGGFFGVLHAVGKTLPFEEGKSWAPSWGYALYVEVGRLFGRLRLLTAKDEAERYRLEKAMIKMPAATDDIG